MARVGKAMSPGGGIDMGDCVPVGMGINEINQVNFIIPGLDPKCESHLTPASRFSVEAGVPGGAC